jgi:hypothetical protein
MGETKLPGNESEDADSKTSGSEGDGHAPDTSSEILAGTQDSSVTLFAGAAYASQQNSVSSRVNDALDLLNRHPKCEEALNEVLSRLSAKTGVKRFDNIRSVLEQFRKDGSITETPDGNSSVTDSFRDHTGIRLSVSPNREVTAEILLHELLHYAGGPNLAKSIGGNQYASNYGDPDIYEAWKDMGVIKSYEEWMKEPAVSEWYKQHPESPGYTKDRMSGSAQRYVCLDLRSSPIR